MDILYWILAFFGGCTIATGIIFWLDKKPLLVEEKDELVEHLGIDDNG